MCWPLTSRLPVFTRHKTRETRDPDIGFIRRVCDEIHGLVTVSVDDGEGTLLGIMSRDVLVTQDVRILAITHFLDLLHANWKHTQR